MLSAMQARLSLFSIPGTDPVDFNCSRVASQALPQSFASASLVEHFDPASGRNQRTLRVEPAELA